MPIKKTWNSATVVSFAPLTWPVQTALKRIVILTVDHVAVKQLRRMALINKQDPDEDQPLRRAEHRPEPVLTQGQQGQDGEAVCESEEIEEIARAAHVLAAPREEVARVHLADEDVGHDPRGSKEVGLPYAWVAAGEVEHDKGDDGEGEELV